VVGDTTAFAPRILSVDQQRNQVTFEVNAPAHVLLVSVSPGEFAIPVGALPDRALAEAGTQTLAIVPGQSTPASVIPGQSTPAGVMSWGSLDQQDYERCVSRGRRSLPKRRVVSTSTDSTGKTSVVTSDELDDPHDEVALDQRCEAGGNKRTTRAATQAAAPRATRYLVLLASDMPVMLADVIKRFEEMRNIPTDVPSVVSNVAAALYGDRKGIWSAYYVRW
jgi:hypothetical protein